ncbi:MAG: GTP-binding protein HflX [Planctomycetota bacterium]|jgi:GTP-binding protein HflX
MSKGTTKTRTPRERILLCGVILDGQVLEHDGELSEIKGLVEAAGGEVIGTPVTQRRERQHPATMLGKGKVEEIGLEVEALQPSAVAVDNDLSPAQGRNLEKAWGCRVIDRSELILDIFATRARTRQAKLQVELAQTEYIAPRLLRMWTHLERTEGAIGTRGPGETQLETDRRLMRKRITDLKRELKGIELRKQREVVSRSKQFTIGLVGYTNAGKSTLLNRLTGSDELVADMLFATLDTRTRQWKLSDGRVVLLSDTVGFLGRLPHHLVASFHATLEETLNADLLLHVVDASHPDAPEQMAAVDRVLGSLSHSGRTGILVLNKVDALRDPIELTFLTKDREERIVHLSAKTGEGVDRLDAMICGILDARSALLRILLPLSDGKLAAQVRRTALVLEEKVHGETELLLRVRMDHGSLGSLKQACVGELNYEVLEPAAEALSWES